MTNQDATEMSFRRAGLWGLLATTALGGLVLSAQAAQAQNAPQANGAIQLETVTVTEQRESGTGPVNGYVARQTTSGSKTDTPLIETPQSVSVVGREQIEDQGAQSVVEATRYSPGVRSESFGADPRNDWFLIRGFPAQTTGYYLDSLQLFSTSFATFKLEPYGLERIEILRGPSSVLYGGGNPGGLVNAISKKPPMTPFREVTVGVNNYGNTYGAFDLGGPVALNGDGNQFYYRIVGLGRIGDTQVDHTEDNRAFIAPSLTWKPNQDTTLTILGSYQKDQTNGQNFLPYEGTVVPAPFGRIPTKLFTSNPGFDSFEREQAMIGYQFEHRFNETWTVRQNLRYNHLKIDFATLYGGGYAAAPTANEALLSRFNFVTKPSVDLFTVDNQAEARFATGPLQHTLLLGLDYKRYSIDDEQGFEFGPSLNLLNPVYPPATPTTSRYVLGNTTQTQVGAYVQDQVKFDRFTLVLSGRQDWVNTDNTNNLFPSSSYEGNDSKFSGRVGLVYNTDLGLAPYVSYSRSFDPQIGTNFATGRPLDPETGEQIEVGLKYQPVGMNSFVTVAMFDLKRQNVLTTDPSNALFQVQTGEVRSQGVEFAVNANLMEGLNLVGAYTLYDLETTKDLNPANIGLMPTGTPESFGSLWLDYTVQEGTFRGFGVGAGVRFVGESYADAANTLTVPSYTVADAALHYERDNWRVALNVSNLFDEVYVGSCSGPAACFYGDRRKATLSASYKW
ncbi:TonB-dependent siderophore receptor [Microvirga guangxiensis]|uniref:Iron complex outermembrane recepter protein n=1 Tax=Microvirga guangxiensis TaxID=549386 RepID=A0A1G5ED29_9HYPH|nr:TonB-dependent siderophore receptor [Microvirga guangxiensis]SCY24837.1 iron complex outermembrane recepter protein [Microvirga guangxiensis]